MTKLLSARIKASYKRVETPYVVTKKTDNKYKDWICKTAWRYLEKWGYIQQHFDDVKIEVFDFTESKRKQITERIIEEIRTRAKYHDENVMPDTHVIVMGENTFFEIMNEKRDASPFLADNYTFMTNDMYYNDPYRGKRVLHFSCHVIKGMEGFAIIPKVFVEVRKF
jgi:hypothetical protein